MWQGKRPLERSRRRQEDNIKADVQSTVCGVDSGSRVGSVAAKSIRVLQTMGDVLVSKATTVSQAQPAPWD
jgi:hypothetical protein